MTIPEQRGGAPGQVVPDGATLHQHSRVGTAALIVGIAAVVLSLSPFGFGAGVIALTLGTLALVRRERRSLGLAGLILGILAALVSIVSVLALLTIVGIRLDEANDMAHVASLALRFSA